MVALANTVVPVAGYLAVTALVWAIADVRCNGATDKVAVASRRERFRPIMLTGISTVLGMIPITPTIF